MAEVLEQKLVRFQKEYDNFVYRVSHDLQAPLRTIIGFSTLLTEGASERLEGREKEELALISSAAKQAQALLDSLLRYARLSKKTSALSNVDVTKLATEAAGKYTIAIKEQGGQLAIEALPNAYANEELLGQVLELLLDNAAKFSSAKRAPNIKIYGRSEKGAVHITVEDNGIGIAEKHQEQIFDIFRKLNGDQYAGIGEGLAFAKKLMEMQEGDIKVASKPDEGSRFTIILSG